jgi:hypothetical protein
MRWGDQFSSCWLRQKMDAIANFSLKPETFRKSRKSPSQTHPHFTRLYSPFAFLPAFMVKIRMITSQNTHKTFTISKTISRRVVVENSLKNADFHPEFNPLNKNP